jgi:hypothetical protein
VYGPAGTISATVTDASESAIVFKLSQEFAA